MAWARGLLPDYRPSHSDLILLAKGLGEQEPTAIVGIPIPNAAI